MHKFLLYCNFPMTPDVRRLVGWLVGRSVYQKFLKGQRKLHFHVPIGALYSYSEFFLWILSSCLIVVAARVSRCIIAVRHEIIVLKTGFYNKPHLFLLHFVLPCLSYSLSFHLSIYLSMHQAIYLPINSFSVFLSVFRICL